MISKFPSIAKQIDRRLVTIFLLGVSSGLPWVIIGSALSAWLKDSGFTRSAIGYIGAAFLAYSINFLWAPLLDRVKVPILGKLFGQRRGWILTCQLLITSGCLMYSIVDLQQQMMLLIAATLLISFSSATQDIAIDGLRIDYFNREESDKIPLAASMATAGWWTGYAAFGSIPLILSDLSGWNWSMVYQTTALMMLSLMLPVFWLKEPKSNREQNQAELEKAYQVKLAAHDHELSDFKKSVAWFSVTAIEPIREFFHRNGTQLALSILLFVLIFKMGEAVLGRMSVVFYKEIGFSNTDIAIYSKMVTWWVTVIFSLIGGWITAKQGILKGLVTAGIAMAASNLLFALLAVVGPDVNLMLFTVVVDGFTAAWGTVAFVSFISLLCSHTFSASQYALMASIGTIGRTFIGSYSGVLIDDYLDGNWVLFFVITAVMVIPALLLLFKIWPNIKLLEKNT